MQSVTIEQTDSQCVATWRYFCLSLVIFFILLAGVIAGIVYLCYLAFTRQELIGLVIALGFTLPLCGVGALLLAVIAHMLYGKTRFVLDENGLESVYTCFQFKIKERIVLADIRRFEKYVRQRPKGGSTTLLRVICRHKEVDFTPPAGEIDNLCNRFNIFLGTLKAEIAGVPAKWEVPAPIVIGLDTPPSHLKPPLGTRWRCETEYKGIKLQKRGEDKIGDVIGSLFTAIFWNGVVSIFVLILFGVIETEQQPQGNEWWVMFVFLIPFVACGLYLIVGVLDNILEWFRITTWRLAHGEAEFRTVRLFARTARHTLTGWNSLAVCLPEGEEVKPELIAEGNHDAIREFYNACDSWQVAFFNAAGERLMAIENLHKPEAQWMADVCLREQRTIR